MAVPTVTTVDPSSGSTRGLNIVKIEGSGFRLPDPPDPVGEINEDQPKTVSVQFEGQESEWAYSASDSLILARVPQYRGPYDVSFPVSLDVRVANLDNSGAEIPGERATLTDGYDVERPSLVHASHLQRVLGAVIELFRRHVTENTHYTTSRDYSLTPALQKTMRASGPLVQLTGPRLVLNRFRSLNREDYEGVGTDEWIRTKPPVTVDVQIGVNFWANQFQHLHGLVQAYLLFHRDIHAVRIDIDPADPSAGTRDYEFALPWTSYPDVDTEPSADDLISAVARSEVRGVQIDEDSATIVERGWDIVDNDGYPVVDSQ